MTTPITYAHHTARAREGLVPLLDTEVLTWLWQHLRAGFPTALAVILMPDHLHIVGELLRHGRRRLAAILGGLSQRFGLGAVWQPVPEPHEIRSRDKLIRGVRYVWLNCCRPWRRVQLVGDPLLWPWSTLRDVVGAVADPWVDAARLATALDWSDRDPAASLHRYGSSDPSVAVDGTPFPRAAPPTLEPTEPLATIAEAAAACVRSTTDAIRRRGPARTVFAALAHRQGWRQPSVIARACDVTTRSVSRLVEACPAPWLEAAALCLGDARLRAMDTRVPPPGGRW